MSYLRIIPVALLVVASMNCTLGLHAKAASIEVAEKKQITSVDSRHPEIVRANNGDLVLVFSGTEGVGHDNSLQHLMCMTSSDDGATWSDTIDIFPLDGNNLELRKDPYIFAAPNGDLICSYTNPHQENTGCFSISSDNGKTWDFKGQISPDLDPPCRRFTGGDVVGNTIYACGETFEWDTVAGLPATFWKSTDNGSTWESVCDQLANPTINEWDVLALNESHFIAVARTYPTDGKTLFFESNDAGKNWSVPVDISAMTGVVQDPNLNWLSRDAGTIILHGRRQSWDGFDARSAFWISRDSGATWTDYTPVTNQNTADEYSGFAEYAGQSKGYLVWGENARLYGSMITEVIPPLVGDLDGNGFVGGGDLDILRANWGKTRASSAITYDACWDASGQPEQHDPSWEFRGDPSFRELVGSGGDAYLNIDTPATAGDKTQPGSYNDYTINNRPDIIDASQSLTVDFRVRINGQSDPADLYEPVNCLVLYSPDGEGGCDIYAIWLGEDFVANYEMDTSQWHDYRVVFEHGNDAVIYLDGDPEAIASVAPSRVEALDWNGIRWGDVSDSRAGDADWQFIGWKSGLWEPEELSGDLDGDGIVGPGDLDVLEANWGLGDSSTSTSSVPEPTLRVLILAALATLTGARF